MKKIKLTSMNQSELQSREMERLIGGNDGTPCLCGCAGPSSNYDNKNANYKYGYGGTRLPEYGCACACGGSENTSTGGLAASR